MIAYFIIKIVILWPGRLFEELNSEIYYDISKRKLPKPNKTQFSAPTFGPALPTCASAESKGHLCPRDIAKDCLLTLVKSRLALGSPGCSVGCLVVTMPKMGEYTEK